MEPILPEEYRVAMRDQVELATDVYLPAGWSSGPVVLSRVPYGKRERYIFLDRCAPHFAERGYALVVQDVRGTGASGGETLPYVHEVPDGYDTLEWIVNQPWSNGAIGMFGDSYYGYTQWAALASRHPALKAMVPRMASVELPFDREQHPDRDYVTPTDAGPGLPATGDGISRPASTGWALALATIWSGVADPDFDIDLSARPPLAGFEAAFSRSGHRSAAFDRTIPRTVPAAVFPDGHPFEAPPIPILHTIGWFDPVGKRGMAAYLALRDLPAWRDLQYLTADSVDHENYHLDDVPIGLDGDHEESDAALERLLPRYLGEALDFFDVHLAGAHAPAALPPVRWHLGHVGYATAATWPPPGSQKLTLHLDGLRRATGPNAGGSLTATPPSRPASATWRHDPANPVTAEGSPLNLIFDDLDERHTSARSDVLSFDTPPFAEPLDLAGAATVGLTVGSDGDSLDLYVHLIDVHPDGKAQRLLSDQVTVDVTAGPRWVHLELGHIGYRVRPGHRLRVTVAGSEFPHYLVHPGVEGNRWTETRRLAAVHTVMTTPTQPARLELNLLTPSALPTTTKGDSHERPD
jgi:putative CocE/NonD family hydrolase